MVQMNSEPTARCSQLNEANPWRREEYRINKRVEQRGAEKVFIRTASTKSSQPFLAVIYEREQSAIRNFDGVADIITGRLEQGALVYPYVTQPTLEEKISTAIGRDEEGFGLALVKEYVAFVRSLPTVLCVPRAFYDLIKYPPDATPLECLTFGPYDCIPQNILVGRDGWKILDLEWTFDFPLPQRFLLWRGLVSLLHTLQDRIKAHISERSPVFLLQGYGRNRIYLPLAWCDAFEVRAMDLDKYGLWEQLFYRRVLISQPKKPSRVRLNDEPHVYKTLPTRASLFVWIEEIVRKAVHRVRHLRRISNQAL